MEHAEARELLEIGAVEPGGFERLMAGDTPEAAALAGHVAGCLECAAEMERLRRSAAVIRDAVRTLPSPELKERTLAFVAAVGRPRGETAGATVASGAPVTSLGSASVTRDEPRRLAGGGLGRSALWAATLAAAVVIAIIGTTAFVTRSLDARLAEQAEDISSLTRVATWTLRIDGTADARHVELAGQGTTGAGISGTLVFSPTSGELVVLASGLPKPAAGMEYRCWVDIGGNRRRIGQMFFGGDVAYWAGPVTNLSDVDEYAHFGVSLVPSEGDAVSGDPILLGEL